MHSFFPRPKKLESYRRASLSPQVTGDDFSEIAPLQGKIIHLDDQITRKEAPLGRRCSFDHIQHDEFAFDGGNHLQPYTAERIFRGRRSSGTHEKKCEEKPGETRGGPPPALIYSW